MERKGGMRMPWSWLWDPGGEINEGVGIWIGSVSFQLPKK